MRGRNGLTLSRKSVKAVLVFASVMYAAGCAVVPPATDEPAVRIGSIPGPEDMVLDRYTKGTRLLVSSADRRGRGLPGEIYAVDTVTLEKFALPRAGGPGGRSFSPHGLSLVMYPDGTRLLYVVNHYPEEDVERYGILPHSILIFQVYNRSLNFLEEITDPLLVSPNDLSALPDGTIYVTNDGSGGGGMLEIVLGMKRATVVMISPEGESRVVAEDLAMANGIQAAKDELYVAVTRENAVYRYHRAADGTLSEREELAYVKGPDNLTLTEEYLLVAAHLKDLALARHMSDPMKPAPSVVYRIDRESGARLLLYADGGETISAASVAVPTEGYLFIGQIAGDYLIRVRDRAGR